MVVLIVRNAAGILIARIPMAAWNKSAKLETAVRIAGSGGRISAEEDAGMSRSKMWNAEWWRKAS